MKLTNGQLETLIYVDGLKVTATQVQTMAAELLELRQEVADLKSLPCAQGCSDLGEPGPGGEDRELTTELVSGVIRGSYMLTRSEVAALARAYQELQAEDVISTGLLEAQAVSDYTDVLPSIAASLETLAGCVDKGSEKRRRSYIRTGPF